MLQLTEKQQITFETIIQYIRQWGKSPTFTELRSKLGIKSNQSLIDRLASLERKELLIRKPKQQRSISLGPKASEYFSSLTGYTFPSISHEVYSQFPGTTLSNTITGNIEIANTTMDTETSNFS